MPRPAALLCLVAASATGLALAAPATAAPSAGPGVRHAAASHAAHQASAPQVTDEAAPAVADELVVVYEAGAAPAERERARRTTSAARKERLVAARGGRAEVELVRLPSDAEPDAAIRALERDPAVAYAEPNWTYTKQGTPSESVLDDGRLWGMLGATTSPANEFGSGAATAWEAGHIGSKEVYVGVIDEGIQVDHPDLDQNVWQNPLDKPDGRDNDGNGYVDDVNGYDFANGDSSVYDGGRRGSLDDHGTHVAGTIGAEADGSGVVGVNQSVTLISGKFLGRNGGSSSAAIRAIDYFVDLKQRGLNIVALNNSWGGGGYSQALHDAISRADDEGILFVAAAGNDGTDNDSTPSYPANYDLPNVISVAAIDSRGGLAAFSQYGATQVDLGAPGVGIISTTAYKTWSSYNGTSMATPHVTGAAALYASTHPGSTAAQIKTAILQGAEPTPSLAGKTTTGGRLDASGF